MKKRRHRAKSDILIDLTSLLDVIFIVLLVVLGRQMTLNDERQEQINAEKTAEESMAEAESAKAEYLLYLDQLETEDQVQNMVYAISVTSYYNEEDVTERYIKILGRGTEEIQTFELRGENVRQPLERFQAALEEYAVANEDFPVILSLTADEKKMLYRDEQAIEDVFEVLREKFDNVYVK